MANLTQLRLAARAIFEESLRSVDPAGALRNAARFESSVLTICGKGLSISPGAGVFAVAIGKAGRAMADALDEILGDLLVQGVISAPNSISGALSSRWQHFGGGHPLPNEASLAAAKAAFAMLDVANEERALVIFLVSGGGSAMMEWPSKDDITLEELRAANQTLVNSGASIGEINAVRRAFSAVKGGRLAERAPNCRQVTLIVSDVPSGDEQNVASGPSVNPGANAPSSADVLTRYRLRGELPSSILRATEPSAEHGPPGARPYYVLLDNHTALKAAASAMCAQGLAGYVALDISDQAIDVGVDKLLTSLAGLRKTGSEVCLVSGGEFRCPVRGSGIGGRNLETALRLVIEAEKRRDQIGDFVALCAGTDGIDGNSPAAGAIVDSTTMERARRIGLDPIDFLNRSDSYSFFVALGDTITTGPTGTNVRDLRILLSGTRQD